MEKYGFVYIWYDRKRKMYYIGSHWGFEDDGYICSSNRMRDAYRRRKDDFKRRILSRVYTSRDHLLDEEQKWIDRIKDKSKYYNLCFQVKQAWWSDQETRLTVGEKISKALTGRKVPKETGEKISASNKGRESWNKGKKASPETLAKMSIAAQGKKHSQESKNLISEKMKGKNSGKSNGPRSQETRDKISKATKGKNNGRIPWNKGKVMDDAYRAKLSEAHKGQVPWNKGVAAE